jgi:nucleotide sugar dehydrogenase
LVAARFTVLGMDSDENRVSSVREGRSYLREIPDEALRSAQESKLLQVSGDMSRLRDTDVVIIAVPTPLNKNLNPDLQNLEEVARTIARWLRQGQLIVLESTTYPGTTEGVIMPLLEQSGLKTDVDFFLAHSPERVDPANATYTIRNTPKVVAGSGPASLELVSAFYRQSIEQVVPVSSLQAAELTKVFENTFRAVNIALVNELALLCDRMRLDVWEILDAAYSKPFGIMPFYPGPGVGGHCIPLDPHYLEWKAREYNFVTRFIALAGEINRKMPEFVVDKALRLLSDRGMGLKGSRILVLGVAYKRNVEDSRESPAVEIIRMLQERQACVSYHDPHVPDLTDAGLDLRSVALTDETLRAADLVLILTDHEAVDYDRVVRVARQILDTRNATRRVREGAASVTLL